MTGIPGAPANPVATWLGAGKAKATWDQPGSDGGEAIDKYTVRFYPAGSTTAAKACSAIAPALSCSVAGLPAGTYTVRVQAHNAAGWGPLSDSSAAITG
ncbi:MAG: fibronectin type III domain-containing protein [Candidatus Nanopelagicales bacterium]